MTTPENHDAPSGLPAPASTPKPGDSYVQSFARGLEVIRSFSASAPQQTLSEVAAHTGHRLGRRVSYLVDHETVSPQKRTSGMGQNTNPKPHPAKPEICSHSELLFV